MRPTKDYSSLAEHLGIDVNKVTKIRETDYSELSKGLGPIVFFAENIKEILTVFGITHQRIADHLQLSKAKMYRRFEDINLWDIGTLQKAIEFVDQVAKDKKQDGKANRRNQVQRLPGNKSPG